MSAVDTKSTSVVVSDENNGGLGEDSPSLELDTNIATIASPTDRYGFFITSDSPRHIQIPDKQISQRKSKEAERTVKWVRMIKTKWSKYMSPSRIEKLKSRCRKGIPDAVRGYAWVHMTGVDAVKEKLAYDSIDTSGINQTVLDEIERDIDRTFPRHFLFQDGGQGQAALRNILRRYAALDREVGYCQGMGFLAGLFLTYMIEEEAFYTFYAVLTRGMGVPYTATLPHSATAPEPTVIPLHSPLPFPLRLLYLPSLAEIQKILHVFTGLCHMHIPAVYGHMESEGVHPTMFFTEWGMCMFTRGFAFDLVTRVWDIYMLEGGYKVVYRVGMAILKSQEAAILGMKFEKIMALLREIASLVDAVHVMELAFQFPLKRKHIEDLEVEYADRLKK